MVKKQFSIPRVARRYVAAAIEEPAEEADVVPKRCSGALVPQ